MESNAVFNQTSKNFITHFTPAVRQTYKHSFSSISSNGQMHHIMCIRSVFWFAFLTRHQIVSLPSR